MPDKHIVLAGGSGFIGHCLTGDLQQRGYRVVNLSRAPRSEAAAQELAWDGSTLGEWSAALEGATAVINLAGKSVNCRYTAENKHDIIASRVDSVRVLGEAIAACQQPPPLWTRSGSLAIYGDAGDAVCDEGARRGKGFSAEVCRLWEEAFNSAQVPGTRKVYLRIGFVLGQGGGALGTLGKLARNYLGGAAGNGRQYISWLHSEDLNRMFEWAIGHESCEGAYNATGPHPVTNATFMAQLRAAVGRPWSPPIPAFAVRIGCYFMGTEPELALGGRRCVPRRFLDSGFQFHHPDLQETLADVI